MYVILLIDNRCFTRGSSCEILWWARLCACVCLSVREDISGTTRMIFTKYFVHVQCCLWPWLGPSPALLWYVMYFRFCTFKSLIYWQCKC